jgi:hypothetical protein
MKNTQFIAVLIIAIISFNFTSPYFQKSCSIIVYNNRWLIKDYNMEEKAYISKEAKGPITIHETGDISSKTFKKNKLLFRIAIQRKDDNTLISYSEKTFETASVEDVLKKCNVGDHILILLVDQDAYSLPHGAIEVI